MLAVLHLLNNGQCNKFSRFADKSSITSSREEVILDFSTPRDTGTSPLSSVIRYNTTPIHSGNFHFRASALLTFDIARHGLILGRIPHLSEVHKIQISVQLALSQTMDKTEG
ncbi:hypothetical protein OUZ56_030250 [Daphnia magna]|uniref:Uncharacterized protein n=2 Tax=Daphnia magna TaxID=35525 RepID=A0ABQ9ZQR0_9CRUS|nr:hypothetical protein OUZ56_030250 [Daphnia magna]